MPIEWGQFGVCFLSWDVASGLVHNEIHKMNVNSIPLSGIFDVYVVLFNV